MPSSLWRNIPDVMDAMWHLRPTEVFEVGVGCGKYGCLLREYLAIWDRWSEPYDPFRVRIDGVEVWGMYGTSPAWRCYDAVIIAEGLGYVTGLGDGMYDVCFAVDVLEHFEHDDGMRLVTEMMRVSRKGVVLAYPTVYCPTSPVYGNEHEVHRSTFSPAEFDHLGLVHVWRDDDATVLSIEKV